MRSGNNTKKPRLVLTGGSGLLALNWACAMRERWDVFLGTHLHDVKLFGVSSFRIDLSNPKKLKKQLTEISPDLVVHTAGLTDVDRCETVPELANLINAELAHNVAQITIEKNYKLIHISTDQLFEGDGGPYDEGDATNPQNEYGRSKLRGEALVQDAHAKAIVLRTNFFAWGHRNRASFSDWIINSLRKGEKVLLFDDVYFTPIIADALAIAAHDLSAAGCTGIFNLVGDERISKYEFGLRLAEHFGLPVELICRTQIASASLRARRPNDMSLSNAKARDQLGRALGGIDEYIKILYRHEQEGRSSSLRHSVFESS